MTIVDYIKSQLNEEQSKAALHTDTSSLIIAGAGSGKTRTLIYKIAYLVRGKNIPIQKILAVTFTNKAANEMKERLLKISEEMIEYKKGENEKQNNKVSYGGESDDLESFLNAINNNAFQQQSIISFSPYHIKRIGTFHSIFLKILKEDIEHLGMQYTKNFGVYDTNETQSILKDILKRLGLQDMYKVPEVKGFISNQKNNGLNPQNFMKNIKNSYEESMYKIYETYQKELERSNSLDFDDLLLLPYLLFKKNPDILKKWNQYFPYILVDEAQDTNRIQFELMKMLSGMSGNITLIGDDYQSIYGWRGAIMENFLNVKKYWPDIQMFKLQTNYRSRPHIVDAGNQIIKNNTMQYKKHIIAHRTGNDKIIVFSHKNEMDEAANIVDLIKKMKEQGKYKNRSQIAILYRTNAQSSPFEQLFLQEGIPYKVWGAYKFFERKEIKDILAYIKYILNPYDNVSLKRILNVPSRRIGKTSIHLIEEFAITHNMNFHEVLKYLNDGNEGDLHVNQVTKKGIKEFLDIISELKMNLPTLSPSQFIEFLIKKIKYKNYLLKEEGNEQIANEKYENIGQLINMAEKYEPKVKNEKIDNGEILLKQFMEEVILLSDISENESGDIDAVKLMTVHSSKGLEFPIVFVVGLEERIFPLANALQDHKMLEEERRLMYVAVTRAKDILFLSHAHQRMTRGEIKSSNPSRFLDEISFELIKKYDLAGGSIDEDTKKVFNEGDKVKHKLWGIGYIIEIRTDLALVRFQNSNFGTKKIAMRFLEKIE